MRDLFEDASLATISPCLRYRYRLERATGVPGSRVLAVVMVNPSTADHRIDDHTIRKVRGFATRMGYARFVVGNLFAFRATDVNELRVAADPVGPENDAHLRGILSEGEETLVAWGPLSKLPRGLRGRWVEVESIARRSGRPLVCLGTARDGQPLHPLTLGYDVPPRAWIPPIAA